MRTKIEVERLSKMYRSSEHIVVALKDVSFKVYDGEFLCIVGPSGCGKSTLMQIIAGLEAPTSGKVLVDGREVRGPGPDRCLIFQESTLFPWRTLLQNVEYGLEMRGVPPNKRRRIAMKYIELVGLKGFENSYPHQLSGGMKKRGEIARALAVGPEVLLMDEPFGNLDAQTRKLMQNELLRIWEGDKRTVVFVTHSVSEAVYLADRILIMTARPGRIKGVVKVDIPRPRDDGSPGFLRIRESVLKLLEEEVAKAFGELAPHRKR